MLSRERRRQFASIFATFALVAPILLAYCVASAAAEPYLAGHYFRYSISRWVANGGGEYEGYHEDLSSHGTYTVLGQTATHVTFQAEYTWKYSNTEGLKQSGQQNRNVQFLLSTRRYATSRTDLDDWDSYDGTTLAVWFWIPNDVKVGDSVQVLDETYAVKSLDATVWSNLAPKKGIELHAEGVSSRNDDYGMFSIEWKDTFYFDRNSGFIIAERYSEHDTGTWQGKAATFDLFENLNVEGSSYEIPLDLLTFFFFWSIVAAIIYLVAYMGYRIIWRTRTIYPGKSILSSTKIVRVRRLEKFPRRTDHEGRALTPFIQDFANKALLAKDIVTVAMQRDLMVGAAYYNREAKIGTILCTNTGITESLRRFIHAKDFFSEVRHEVPVDAVAEASLAGVKLQSLYAYNVFETHQILKARLEGSDRQTYDTMLVTRMKEEDLPEVGGVAKKVYKVRSRRWLKAQLLSGDAGFVARVDNKIVGFAFATYIDNHGRIHTATVLPEYRGRGIGKEMLRARLQALRDLGAIDVIAEVGDWNMPSLHLLWAHGFRSTGTMYVETARRKRIRKNIVRR